ncbi:MAG: adenylate/guanylate cyclase domain-containing protein [Acidimicrobiales bacterium]
MSEPLDAGRAAAAAGQWRPAYAALHEASAAGPLAPDDLELLGWAAAFSARPEEAVDARQRAFAAVRASEPHRAGMLAVLIALGHLGRGAHSVALGWIEQANALLADEPESEGAMWLAWVNAVLLGESGARSEAAEAAEELVQRARRVPVVDVEALATLLKGQLLTSEGRAEEGAKLIDPVMALAVGGCLGPIATAWIYSGTISTCASTGDFERAWEWTDEVGRCSARGSPDFPGDCRLHRAEMLRLRGDWAKAEVEAASVCDELGSWHGGHAAAAYYELGEISMLRGDLESAGEAFARAQEHGHPAQPGRASLELLRGRPQSAVALVEDALRTTTDLFSRSNLLPVAVDANLAAARPDAGAAAARELADIAAQASAPIHRARAAHAAGAVALATGDLASARSHLADAVAAWHRVGAPYDEAISRLQLALAEEEPARRMHLEDALAAFARLGASLDVRKVEGHIGRVGDPDRVTKAFMFTDIEGSTAMLTELGDNAWLAVLRRHDAALRQLFVRFDGEELTSTGDGFFVDFPTADDAIGCALEIQRAVREVRVRVGVHLAEANLDRGGYSGRGIHEAARVSAVGRGGDIVVSAETLERATNDYPVRERQTVQLKGLPGTMELAFLELRT